MAAAFTDSLKFVVVSSPMLRPQREWHEPTFGTRCEHHCLQCRAPQETCRCRFLRDVYWGVYCFSWRIIFVFHVFRAREEKRQAFSHPLQSAGKNASRKSTTYTQRPREDAGRRTRVDSENRQNLFTEVPSNGEEYPKLVLMFSVSV